MAKISKVGTKANNLLSFSDTFKVDSHHMKGSYWQVSNLKVCPSSSYSGYADVGLFEQDLMDKIMGWSDWKPCAEYELLNAYFKKGGKLSNVAYFYSNISKIKEYRHGTGSDLVYAYAKNVIKGRLPSEAEGRFLKDLWKGRYSSRSAYKYAKYVIRNRLPVDYEKDCNDLDYLGFVESKGHDIAEILINSSTMSYYYYRKFCYLPEVVHNFLIAMQLSGDYYANLYFRQRRKDAKLIKNRLRMIDGSKKVEDVIKELKG